MKIEKFLLFIVFCLSINFCLAQTIQGYTFSKYPAKVYAGKKALLNRKGSVIGNMYKTQITNQYKVGKVDFAGHYITTTWGIGTGLTIGAMVDAQTGKVYELPIGEDNALRDPSDYGNENIFFNSKSNLFICYISSPNSKDEKLLDRTYSIFKWDDVSKKFILLKKKTVTVKMPLPAN